jgi:DNA-binding transcriptional regulator/RsmH inhibitor MraZ
MEPDKQDIPAGLVGQRDITVLDDGRIKLPGDIMAELESLTRLEKVLYPGRIPQVRAIVLCPEEHWDHWQVHLQSQFPLLKTHPGAIAYLHPFKPATWDRYGRVSLPAAASYYAGIRKGISAVLIGKGYYLELWPEEEFKKALRDCEAALAKAALRQPSSTGRADGGCPRTPGGETR